jgi:outer membrane protein assembly factor BamB
MKRSVFILLLLLLAVAGVFYGITKMHTPRAVMAAADERAIRDFEQRLKAEEGADRWALKVGKSTVTVYEEAGQVLRHDANGKVEWETQLDGSLRSLWWPNLLSDGDRIFVKQFKGVWAIDRETGKVIWHVAVPNECFWLSGNLLLLAEGRQVVALAADTGTEVFRLSLPAAQDFRPVAIDEAAGLLMVQTHEDPFGKGDTFLFDRKGRVRYRFPRQVVAVVPAAEDRVFLTSADIRRVTPDGQTIWSTPLMGPECIAGGRIVEAPDGDLVVFSYCRIANTGVQLIRIDPVDGQKRWEAYCNPLSDVVHSQYLHAADVEWYDGHLRVLSHGSAGNFVECLDGQTGNQMRRSEERR